MTNPLGAAFLSKHTQQVIHLTVSKEAKAVHTLLCCETEGGTVSWDDPFRIDRIRRAHAQMYVGHNTKSWGKTDNSCKS